jgi:hypothetical protein
MVKQILHNACSPAVYKIHDRNQFRDDPLQLHRTLRQKLNPNQQAQVGKPKIKLQQNSSMHNSTFLSLTCLSFCFLGHFKNHT